MATDPAEDVHSGVDAPMIWQKGVEALGIGTNYFETGAPDARTIILLHGMSSSADTFRRMMVNLGGRYRLIAPDIPGFGRSEETQPYTIPHLIEWLAAFLVRVDVGPVHILGHSFGGALGVSQALTYPRDVESLILLAPSVLHSRRYPDWISTLAKFSLVETILDLGMSASRLVLQRQMRASFYAPERLDDALWQRRAVEYEQARASAAVLRALALHDVRPRLGELRQETCIIWGKNDPVLNPKDALRLADLTPQSHTTLHLLPQCGHAPHIEQPDAVLSIVDSFLQEREMSTIQPVHKAT
jgi:pimeloyl-ACP methyl ester carboxylesterase